MEIRLNGEAREIDEGTTVAALLAALDIRRERVAVEVNLEVIRKAAYDSHLLREGDQVEVVSFVGGG